MDQFRRPHHDSDEDPRSSAFTPPSIIRPESASSFSKPILPSSSSLLSPKQQFGAPITSNGGAASPASAPAPDRLTAPSPAGTRYRECLRNHAASLGGHVIDGCGEFMPAGPTDPLKCAACGCHRSFHRKEAPLPPPDPDNSNTKQLSGYRVPLLLPPANPIRFSGNTTDQSSSEEKNTNNANPTNTDHHHHHPHISSYDHRGHNESGSSEGRKKRFRTKFSSEQKERMKAFADRVGWRVQKKDEGEMERFCGEISVSRQVLKVWMHNNKHLVKKPDVKMEAPPSMQLHHNQQMQQHIDGDPVDRGV